MSANGDITTDASREGEIEVERVTKRFGDVTAVDDLSFGVEAGQVYGLLGPNGAGKTTALRCLMGLERPTGGRTRLFGTEVRPGTHELFRVGAIIEQAAFVPHLSGLRNLRLWWEAGGGRWRDADLEPALAVAQIGDAVHRKVKTYSQGMQQRLGFARALLGRPELLVLDEPTNGLDPGEIRVVRELIHRLADEGRTVVFSSHHLSEVEQTCSHAVVVNHGRRVAEGTVASLIGGAGSVLVEVDDPVRARAVLEALPEVTSVTTQGLGLNVEQRAGSRADLGAALVGAGVRVETLTTQNRLEDAFLRLMEDSEPADAAGAREPQEGAA